MGVGEKMTSSARQLEEDLISMLKELKYIRRKDIRDQTNLIAMAPIATPIV